MYTVQYIGELLVIEGSWNRLQLNLSGSYVHCTVHLRITSNRVLMEKTTVNGFINQSDSYVHCTVHWRILAIDWKTVRNYETGVNENIYNLPLA